jgi:hypothetical protein
VGAGQAGQFAEGQDLFALINGRAELFLGMGSTGAVEV